MEPIKAVFFDVDGVLLDSLTAHLQICCDKAVQYGLPVAIPTPTEFKALIRRGVSISPMEQFFLAVGFPEASAKQADLDYQREFRVCYPLAPFRGVDEMLSFLGATGMPLGIITSNTLSNIRAGLGAMLDAFDHVFAHDTRPGLSKADALTEVASTLGLATSELLYVGDQPSDLRAARQAGTQFLAVTYGWGFADDDEPDVTKAHDLSQVVDHILDRCVVITP